MQNMPHDGIYVTFIYPAKGESRDETIKLHGNKYYLTVSEILEFFGIKKLGADEKIWVQRKGTSNVRPKAYELNAQLHWEDFSKCAVIIAPNYEAAMKALNDPQTKPIAYLEAQYQQSLQNQLKLWQKKKKEKEEKGQRIPKVVAARKKAIRIIVKKKRKARLEMAKKQKEEDDNAPEN